MNTYAEVDETAVVESASLHRSPNLAKKSASGLPVNWQRFTLAPMPVHFANRGDVLKLKLPEGEVYAEFAHASLRGFYVKVTKSGHYYQVRTRVPDPAHPGKTRTWRKEIGSVFEVSFPEAQRQALSLLENARMARRDRETIAEVVTLADAWRQFLDDPSRKRPLAPDSVRTYQARWTAHLAQWQELPITRFTRQQFQTLATELAATPTLANQVLMLARGIFRLQVRTGTLAANPCAGFRYHAAEPRKRRILAAQLPAVWQWLHTQCHPLVRDYVLVGLMTGLRESAIGGMRWEWIDATARTLTLPADQRGNKTKREVTLPISDELWSRVFEPRLPDRSRWVWVLPSHKWAGRPLTCVRGSLAALRVATGVQLSDHDLRRTFATAGYAATGDLLVVSRLLSHSQARSVIARQTSDYIGHGSDDLRTATNRISSYIVAQATKQ
jgi:integrase